MLGQYSLQVTLNVVNTDQTRSVTPTLVICVVSEGTFTILDNRSISQIGVVSAQDVLDAKQHLSDYVDYELIQEVNGGNFFNGLKAFGSKIMDALRSAGKKAYEIGKKIAPYVQKGLQIAETVAPYLAGLGEGGVLVGDQEDYRHYGGMPVGGKMISRSKLKNRLRRQ